MESTSINLESQKQKVLEFIETHGPSLPIRISSYLKSDSLIVSAFLSELLKEKKLMLSNMRVGNSPLYFIRGQEFQLENFFQYLGSKEREAFELLKEHGVLEDQRLLPPIRVALRSIKDFSFPFEYKGKLYWHFIKLNQDKAIEMIDNRHKDKPFIEKIKRVVLPKEQKIEMQKPLIEKGLKTDFQEQGVRKQGIEVEKKQAEFISPVKEKPLLNLKSQKKVRIKEKSDFVFDVIDFLERKSFILDNEIDYRKKEYFADVKVDSQLGKVNFYCIAKDKKTITENDLNQALQKSNEEKKPVLLISPGQPNKKAAGKLEEIGNLVFWLKLS